MLNIDWPLLAALKIIRHPRRIKLTLSFTVELR